MSRPAGTGPAVSRSRWATGVAAVVSVVAAASAACGITWTPGTGASTSSAPTTSFGSASPSPTVSDAPPPSAVPLASVGTFAKARAGDNGWFINAMTDHEGDDQWRLALDRTTGAVLWQRELPAYARSSPILIKTTSGEEVGFLCDSVGICHLFDPRTGSDFSTLNVGVNVEASPAAFDDMIVVGTRGGEIWGSRVR